MLKGIHFSKDLRSVKIYKNIIALFTLKGVNIVIGLLMVPLALNYLDTTRYGIWITLSAIFNWFSLFDIGLGHGLRNRLAEALAKDDLKMAKVYLSTAYASISVIFIGVFLLFSLVNVFVNWASILNAPETYAHELGILAGIVFFFFCMRFVTQLISTVSLAKQEPAFSQVLIVGGRVASLAGIYLLTRFTKSSLLYLGLTLTGVPVLVFMILSMIVFRGRYKDLKPSFSSVRFRELKYILDLGVKFFIIQIAAIVFYQTNNIIIAHLFGPAEVTTYSIAYQYFSIATFAFTTILTPYWSAFTDAYTKGEIEWIKKEMRNLRFLWIGLLVFVVLLFVGSDFFIRLWVGNKVIIPKSLSLVMAIYIIVSSFNSIYSHFMNGVGKVMVQFYVAAGLAVFQIPLAIYFCKLFNITGIMFSLIFFGIIQIIIFQKQYNKIINHNDFGIWSK